MIRRSLAGFLASTRLILHVGLPAMGTNLIEPLATAVVTRLLAVFGTAVVAGFGVAARIEAVVFMVVIGIASSTAPLVGQNWGARRFDRVNRALALCYRYCLVWSVIAAGVMWVGGRWFVSLINDEPEVLATATTYLYIIPMTIGFAGMVNVANGAFNACRSRCLRWRCPSCACSSSTCRWRSSAATTSDTPESSRRWPAPTWWWGSGAATGIGGRSTASAGCWKGVEGEEAWDRALEPGGLAGLCRRAGQLLPAAASARVGCIGTMLSKPLMRNTSSTSFVSEQMPKRAWRARTAFAISSTPGDPRC